jgi:hypothetical protein
MIQSIGHSLLQQKNQELAASNDGARIASVQGNDDVTLDVPLMLTNMVSFLQGMKLRYNDGLGTRDIVTSLGTDFVEDMRLKCKIKLLDDSIILIDIKTLNFIENPDIASIPETSEDYFREGTIITLGTHFASKDAFTTAGGNDEPSHLFTSCTIPTINCYGRIR